MSFSLVQQVRVFFILLILSEYLSTGTGKSLLLRAIITALRRKYSKTNDAIAITASTGMTASNVGGGSDPASERFLSLTLNLPGMTIHSWGGVAPNCNDLSLLIKHIKTRQPALQRWKKTKVLIIDEGGLALAFHIHFPLKLSV